MPKTSSIVLLIWHLTAPSEPPGDKYPKQWQWPLYMRGAWRQDWFHQAIVVWQEYWKALGA